MEEPKGVVPCDELYEERAPNSFFAFARGLTIPSASGQRVFELAMLDYEEKGIEPFQRNFFEDVASSLEAIRDGRIPSCRRFWMERTKKGSKDNDAAVCVLWLMAFAKRPTFCQIVAASREQAGIIRQRVDEILFYNEWLNPFVKTTRGGICSRNELGETVIEATDASTGHGGTPDLLILNELTHVAKWKAMVTHYNNASGVPRGVLLVATNAGYKGTEAEGWKKNALEKTNRWHMHVWDKVAPWLNEEDVEDAKSINTRSEQIRLFGRKGGGDNWVSGKGDALSEESIDRVFRPGLQPMKGDEEGWMFLVGLDLGIKKDHAGLAVTGINRGEGRIRVAKLRDWKPSVKNEKGELEVNIAEVKREAAEVYNDFKPVWFGIDPAAGGTFFKQELRMQGIMISDMYFTGVSLNEMATSFMQVMESGILECFENESLRRDLGKFEIKVKQPSGYRLKALSDIYGHADVGTAFVMTLPKAITMLGGLFYSQFESFESSEEDDRDVEITDPVLLDILGGGAGDEREHERERGRSRQVDADPFAKFF